MDRITASLLDEFSQQFELQTLQESKRFEHFACYLAVHNHQSPTFATGDILTGSAIGIDGIAIIVNGALITDADELIDLAETWDYFDVLFIFIQADRSAHFDSAKVGTFAFAVKDLFELDEPKLQRNQELQQASEIIEAIYGRSGKLRRGNPVCRMYFVTTGKLTGDQNLEARRLVGEDDVRSTDLFSSVHLELLGRQELQQLYHQTKHAIARDFPFPSAIPAPDIEGVREALIGLIPAPTLLTLIQDQDGEMLPGIFYDNVRDWQGNNAVNQEIMATLAGPTRARFALMNNGITIIARKMQRTGTRLTIEDYQVVNGCQTCNALFIQRDHLDATVMIPLRLIATEDEDIITAIIRATNRQTEVRDEQFFALTTFPKDLERFFASFPPNRRLYYERRDKQYAKAEIEKTRIVTQDNLLKGFAAIWLNEPHGTTRSAKGLREKMGREVFALGHKLEPYYLVASAAYLLEYRFRNARIPSQYKPARYHILLALRLLANPAPRPAFGSREMEQYSDDITESLWDPIRADDLFNRAVGIIDEISNGNLNRDTIRTLPFTEAVIQLCGVGLPRRRQ
jgi:AIPR protein